MKQVIHYSLICLLALPVVSEAYAKPASPVTASNHDPVEINADTLEVFQEENRAVFAGHVVAIQGKVRLKADKMVVYYRKPDDDSSGKKNTDKKQVGSAVPRKDAIKKIEVTGGVFLSTPQETASGASGLYDVENNIIYLNDQVVLTRGNNTLKGEKLTYNLNTGKSVIGSDNSSVPTEGKSKERVRALFVPDNKGN